MRNYFIVSTCLMLIPYFAFGQKEKRPHGMPSYSREITADFLSNYYQQDGNNAAVTGGIGTEQLDNLANVVILNVPIDSTKKLSAYGGADYYSSASTDNIDNYVSSASSSDIRKFGTLSYSQLNMRKGSQFTVKAGASVEYDYTSFSTGFGYAKFWNEGNTEFNFNFQAFVDQWLLIYPFELRGDVVQLDPNRQSINGQLVLSQILNKRMQIAITADVIYMHGLLSTPFHRVYFQDKELPDIERLPSSRLKLPIGARFNWAIASRITMRTWYRYYYDDFGIQAQTAEIEFPIQLGKSILISPIYRYHTQTASTYFAPYQEHESSEEFYTSDYDLSALESMKYGLSLKYYPTFGLFRTKPFLESQRVLMFKSIEARAAYYERSTGLTAMMGSIKLEFALK